MFKESSNSGVGLAIRGEDSGVAGKLPDGGVKGVNQAVHLCGSTFSVEGDHSLRVSIEYGLNLAEGRHVAVSC